MRATTRLRLRARQQALAGARPVATAEERVWHWTFIVAAVVAVILGLLGGGCATPPAVVALAEHEAAEWRRVLAEGLPAAPDARAAQCQMNAAACMQLAAYLRDGTFAPGDAFRFRDAERAR